MAYFPEVSKIQYEGPTSKNPLSFRHYNPEEVVEGKKLKDLLRYTVCYWHTFRGNGTDPFGAATLQRPWDDGSNSVENAVKRVDVAFEFIEKLGCPFYAFHDRDVAPERHHAIDQSAIRLLELIEAGREHQQHLGRRTGTRFQQITIEEGIVTAGRSEHAFER